MKNADNFFTGVAQVLEANDLRTFPARNLGTGQSRWLGPDPAGMASVDLTNPQTFNRYAYVLSNPLGLVDPSGLGPVSTLAECRANLDLCKSSSYNVWEYQQYLNYGTLTGRPDPFSYFPTSDSGENPNPFADFGGGGTIGGSYPSGQLASPTLASSATKLPAKTGTRPDWLNYLTSIFGYDHRIKLPSCAALAFSTAADDLNPFSPGTFGAVKDGVQAALSTGELYYFNAAISHAASRGLTYPNKSSIFRGLLNKSSNLGKAGGSYSGWLAVDGALGHGFALEMFAMSRGECQ